MSYTENNVCSLSQAVSVKSEPREYRAPSIPTDSISQESDLNTFQTIRVKPESSDAAHVCIERFPAYAQSNPTNASVVKNEDVNNIVDTMNVTMPKRNFFTLYNSFKEIIFSPGEALKEGLGMASSIKSSLKRLQLGSKLRQEVWMRELESLTSQGAPTTLIAVCGATGAGKSSILNAILDDNVVPTSGMRACTAVVTELAYHNKPTIDADVFFLSEAEWKEELAILLSDLIDDDGNLKRSTDLKSDAGVAWSKVHAVYPNISQGQLIHMSADEIIARDQTIVQVLGTTKQIVAADSKSFAEKIGKYIDSKDQKRGDKKKDKEKKLKEKKLKEKKLKEKTLMDRIREVSGTSRSKNGTADVGAPALWPLIRQVNVRCNAAALSTGAILVDLPGVADANTARNNIAKDYMKKCDCIWILAPITRAVDDKTARDLLGDAFKVQLMNGNYDDHTITFIASKCDDISCSEIIRALGLEEDPELEEIEGRIESFDDETSTWKKTKGSAERTMKAIEKELKGLREVLAEHEKHLDALKDGQSFTPRLTAKTSKLMKAKTKKATATGVSRKRKNTRDGKKGPYKRLCSSDINDDEFIGSDRELDSDVDSDFEESENETDSDKESDKSDASSSDEEEDGTDDDEEVTQDLLKEKIKESKNSIKSAREHYSKNRKLKKDANDALAILKKNIAQAQREKNAFCSKKRSEFSKDVLKMDFRAGLKDLDDAAAEKRDPVNFNPSQDIRDYDAVDLPVFTCSSRDYVRLRGQVRGDGEPTCFTNARDTGIPDLQQWCQQLTISSRQRSVKIFLARLKTFVTSVQSYVQGIGDVTTADREDLRRKWESSRNFRNEHDEHDKNGGYGGYGAWFKFDDSDPFAAILDDLGDRLGVATYSMREPKPVSKVDEDGRTVGIAPRLTLEFSGLVSQCVKNLQEHFKTGLEDKCKAGAANAAAAAVATTDEFAASMHWSTYRATLRRHGSWRRDLNVELIMPFTRNIAHSWSNVFESDLFRPFEAAYISSINRLLEDIEKSAAQGLKNRTRMQGEQCLEEARIALEKTMDVVRETMTNEQKEVSRCMAPHVQSQLVDGYNRAMEERGTGSVVRQKTCFRGFIESCRDEIFEDGAGVVMDRLTQMADAVGEALDGALGQLAQKIEVNMSTLWEDTCDDPDQIRARSDIITVVKTVLEHIEYWTIAQEANGADKRISDAMDL